MITLSLYSLLLLLFMLLYLFLYFGLQAAAAQRKARLRLQYFQKARFENRMAGWITRYSKFHSHLRELLETTNSAWSIPAFLFITLLLLLTGLVVGGLFFQTIKGSLVTATILGCAPYLFYRLKLLNLQLKTRLEFLPAVEVFYQYYMLWGQKNVKNALKIALSENRIRYPLRPVFDQFYRNLMTGKDHEHALRLFQLSIHHIWGDYFINIFRVALLEGNNVADNLKDLITDMRKAQRSDQVERNRLLEIRVANFTPILFLAIFLFINFKINYQNAYLFYVVDPAGRNLILDALLLIFASFVMGIFLSMRRM